MRLIDANDISYTMGHLKTLGGLTDFSSKSYASKADINSAPTFDLEKHDEKVKAELLADLEQKLQFWNNEENPIPEYMWDCIKAMK